ncbi:RING finger protein vilya [Lucilia cuprina]|uniref:RING finger protein vilya n=1 Tax=Lucilia cuprina TaxID=7375 RepID=UPI001F070721|nr:RING finger protein vilya [Lucilia cuprina]
MALAQPQQQKSTIKSSDSLIVPRTPYTHWIHCNRCYEQYINKKRHFYLLACDHVCCFECVENISETLINGPQIFKCPLCSRQTRACKLGNEMPPHLKELFHPDPSLDGLNTYRIIAFQEKHQKRFMDYLDRQYNTMQDRKKEVIRIKELARKHYQQMGELKTERKHLEKRVIAIKQQRKEMEENRKNKRCNSSETSSHSSGAKMPKTPPSKNVTSEGITSFSHHSSSSHSFML